MKITIFTIPKPFRGHIDIIQRNAIRSWKKLGAEVEILLLGQEDGMDEFAMKEGLAPPIRISKNEYGTPMLSDAFYQAHSQSSGSILIYSNADIIFSEDLLKAIGKIRFQSYLLIGARYNIDLKKSIDFVDGWFDQLKKSSVPYFSQPGKYGSDYFIFPKTSGLHLLPDFVVGRPYWDNWMIKNARLQRIPVIDCSEMIHDIHQNHDYGHVPAARDAMHEGPEADKNKELYGEIRFSLADATHRLAKNGKVSRRRDRLSWRRRFLTLPAFYPDSVLAKNISKLGLRLLP